MKAIPFEQSGQFFVGKPKPPASSWWAEKPRENFTAICWQEAERMKGSRTRDTWVTAATVGSAGEIQRKTGRRKDR